MGNTLKTQFPSEAVVSESVKSVNLFGPIFLQAFAIHTYRKVQREQNAETSSSSTIASTSFYNLNAIASVAPTPTATNNHTSASKDSFKLDRPPTATEPLERGWLTKLGEVKKNWKRRYFVASEEADNYVIYYYENESDAGNPAKAKGSILPCGYIVKELTSEADKQLYGNLCLVLQSVQRKRCYFLKCDNEDSLVKWKGALRFAALKAQPPFTLDPVLALSYKEAYMKTRFLLGIRGYCALDRSEEAQLAVLALHACEENVLLDLYADLESQIIQAGGIKQPYVGGLPLPNQSAISEAERSKAAIDSALDRLTNGLAASAWPAILNRIELRKDVIERLSSTHFDSISTYLAEQKIKWRGSLQSTLASKVQEIASAVAPQIIACIALPLYKAHKDAIKVFYSNCLEILSRGLKETELRLLYKDVRWGNRLLSNAFRKIRALTRGEIDASEAGDAALRIVSGMAIPLQTLVAMLDHVSLWEVEIACEDSLRTLSGWAIYSFVAMVEKSKQGISPLQCLQTTARNMMHDSALRQKQVTRTILKAVLLPIIRFALNQAEPVQMMLQQSVVVGSEKKGSGPVIAPPTSSPASASAGASANVDLNSIPIPAALPVKVNKKTKSTIETELGAANIVDLFVDNDWILMDLIEETLDGIIDSYIESSQMNFITKLEKLPGKLGFM
jgi:PH domain